MSVADETSLAAIADEVTIHAPTMRRSTRRRWSVSVTIAALMLGVIAILILVVPFLPGYDPLKQNLSRARLPVFSDGHLLGTDPLGRDILSRLAVAGKVSVLIALAVVAINVVIGLVLGLVAGYFGGRVDQVVMGIADIQLTLPFLLILIAVITAVGPSIPVLIGVLGVFSWVRHARVARVITSATRDREFILASITHGASDRWIITKHLLPTVVPQVMVMATFDIGVMVTAEASLSFLGLGVQAPTPSLGGMVAEGQRYIQSDPALAIVPGLVVFLLLGGVAILGQHLSETYGRLGTRGGSRKRR